MERPFTTDDSSGFGIHDYTPEQLRDKSRADLEAKYGVGNVWNTEEMREAFELHSFSAPFCSATRTADGAKGTLTFTHNPRFYFDFQVD